MFVHLYKRATLQAVRNVGFYNVWPGTSYPPARPTGRHVQRPMEDAEEGEESRKGPPPLQIDPLEVVRCALINVEVFLIVNPSADIVGLQQKAA